FGEVRGWKVTMRKMRLPDVNPKDGVRSFQFFFGNLAGPSTQEQGQEPTPQGPDIPESTAGPRKPAPWGHGRRCKGARTPHQGRGRGQMDPGPTFLAKCVCVYVCLRGCVCDCVCVFTPEDHAAPQPAPPRRRTRPPTNGAPTTPRQAPEAPNPTPAHGRRARSSDDQAPPTP
uniref:Uncharacterized protein n=1 Tax=Oryzias latipes TaxID=8090 RepID=A0A3B3H5Y5_ORYLA